MNCETFEVLPDTVVKDRLGRVMISRPVRDALVGKFPASSLTQAEFARREGLNATTFSGWLSACRDAGSYPKDMGRGPTGAKDTGRIARSPTPPGPAASVFRELRIEAATPVAANREGALTIVLPRGIEVRGCDVATAVALIRVLREAR